MNGIDVRHLIYHQADTWSATLAHTHPLRFPGPYVIAGSGSSYYLAQTVAHYAKILGLKARAVPSTDLVLDPELTLRDAGSVLLISRSGETSEALWALEQCHRAERPVTAVSCHPESPLATQADDVLISPEGEDHTVVMIQSFTSMLLLLQNTIRVTVGLSPLELDWSQFIPNLIAATETILRDISLPWRRLYVLGGGVRWGIAQEGMLKSLEMSNEGAWAFRPLEFRHGPWGSVQPDDVVVLLGQVRYQSYELPLAQDLRKKTPHLISVAQAEWFPSDWVGPQIVLPSTMTDEDLGPIAVIPLQWLAWRWTMALGHDPDRPKNLTQVVKLDDTQPFV